MTTAVYQALSDQERREVGMYGCTEAQMREAVEQSLTFRFSGAAMYAMSLMSDCQEMLEHMDIENEFMLREDIRQTLNRAKWILSTYCMKQEGAK